MTETETRTYSGHEVEVWKDEEKGFRVAECPFCGEAKGIEGLPNHINNWCDAADEAEANAMTETQEAETESESEPEESEPDAEPAGLVCPNCGTADTDKSDSPIKDIRPRAAKTNLKQTLQNANEWDPDKDTVIEEGDYLCVNCSWVWS